MTDSPECPAGVCKWSVTPRDPDAMMGHLLVKHNWTFGTANEWMAENWPPVEEWPEPPQNVKDRDYYD